MTPLKLVCLLLFAAIATLPLVGCGGGSGDELTTIRPGPVSEFRQQVIDRAHAIDFGIAALEAEGASVDSASGVAFQEAINELLDVRHSLQQGLGSLDTLTVAQFDVVTDSLLVQLDYLERSVDRVPFDLARDLTSLQNVARNRLEILDEEIGSLSVDADSTLRAELEALAQRGSNVADSVNSAGEGDLEDLRRTVAGELSYLKTTLDSLRTVLFHRVAADSTAEN